MKFNEHPINYIIKCPARCNTKQSIYYSDSSLYMFRVSNTPIIHKTVTTASGTVQLPPSNAVKLATLEGGRCTKIWPVPVAVDTVLCTPDWQDWREVAAQKIWPVPEAVVTVLCTPGNGCGWNAKHVEWTCRITNNWFVLHFVGQLLNKQSFVYICLFIYLWFRSCRSSGI